MIPDEDAELIKMAFAAGHTRVGLSSREYGELDGVLKYWLEQKTSC